MKWLRTVRQGGNVVRFHTRKMVMQQDVAQHSFNAAFIAEEIASRVEEIDAHMVMMHMLLHDIPEQEIGDTPGHIKAGNPELKAALDDAEDDWWVDNVPVRFNKYRNGLTEDEELVCKFADVLECCYTSIEEILRGNGAVMIPVVVNCMMVLEDLAKETENGTLYTVLEDCRRDAAAMRYGYGHGE